MALHRVYNNKLLDKDRQLEKAYQQVPIGRVATNAIAPDLYSF